MNFAKWLDGLSDIRARARILVRIDYGPGYRIYFTTYGQEIIILIAGGGKGSQARDIRTAQRLAQNL